MAEEFGDNILLEKFELEEDEMNVARDIVGKYAKKISILTDYQQIKLEMKVHKKEASRQFEVRCNISYPQGMATSEDVGSNPFEAITNVLNKTLEEIKHKIRK